jgi:cysteine desulfurase
MSERVYLDWNATAPMRPEARAAMIAAAQDVGNPSSVHAEGRAARHLVETARAQVAALVGADPREVIFTSGGTEANVMALDPGCVEEEGGESIGRLLVSAIEHPSVRAGGRFPEAAKEEIPVTAQGVVDVAALERRLEMLATKGIRPLVSIMLANNETGIIQPLHAVARRVRMAGGILHVDATQGCGRIKINIKELDADLMTISSHKLGGPQGVGAVIKRSGLRLTPLMTGGGQERNQRAGTENVPGIAGFGAAAAAAAAALKEEAARMAGLRDVLETGIRKLAPDAVIFGADLARLPNTTLFSVPGLRAETAIIAFDLEGVAVSSGSACSSGKVAPSHVLAAMGVPEALARGAVRVSLGYATTEKEVSTFLDAWAKLAGALYKERGIAA